MLQILAFKMEHSFFNFEREPISLKCAELKEAKQLFFGIYNAIEGEELMEKI